VEVIGRDLCKGLINLVKRLVDDDLEVDIVRFEELLQAWKNAEIEASKTPFKQASIIDRVESIRNLILAGSPKNVNQLIKIMKEVLNQAGTVRLSTIHAAKGLEFQRVFILDEWRIPSKYAVEAYENDPENCGWMIEQERNLKYVGITRSLDQLTYINADDFN